MELVKFLAVTVLMLVLFSLGTQKAGKGPARDLAIPDTSRNNDRTTDHTAGTDPFAFTLSDQNKGLGEMIVDGPEPPR